LLAATGFVIACVGEAVEQKLDRTGNALRIVGGLMIAPIFLDLIYNYFTSPIEWGDDCHPTIARFCD